MGLTQQILPVRREIHVLLDLGMTIEVLLAIAGDARLVYAKLFKKVEYGQVLYHLYFIKYQLIHHNLKLKYPIFENF